MSGQSVGLEVLVLLALIIANGVFAMAEIALLSARKVRLQQRAEEGDAGARAALALAETPDRFLSTVQVGITLVGILVGVFGGATLAKELAAYLGGVPWLAPYREVIAVALVVLAITYLTLVLGELVPKRIALTHPERIAAATAPALSLLARAAAPLVHLLTISTDVVARVLRVGQPGESTVTEAEIRHVIQQGTNAGILEPGEQAIVERVLSIGDRTVGALMTPRLDVIWLDVNDPLDVTRVKLVEHGHSRYPVARGDLDHVLGLVHTRDLLAQILSHKPFDVRALMRPPPFVPENVPALTALERFRAERTPLAFVVDEYGTFQGVISVTDLVEGVVGETQFARAPGAPAIQRRDDGSYLVDGSMLVDDLREVLSLDVLPGEGYRTLGGMMMGVLQRVPEAGDHFDMGGVRFEVVDMDEHRVDKVLIAPPESDAPAQLSG